MIKYFKILLATATAKKTDRWIKIDSFITSKIVKNLRYPPSFNENLLYLVWKFGKRQLVKF